MPENDAFIAGMSGVHFVRLMAELAGLPRAHALERATKHSSTWAWAKCVTAPWHLFAGHEAGRQAGAGHRPRSQAAVLDEPPTGSTARPRAHDPAIQEIRDRGDLHLLLSSHCCATWKSAATSADLKDGKVAAFCNLEEERRANRNFLEIETRGETNGLFLEA